MTGVSFLHMTCIENRIIIQNMSSHSVIKRKWKLSHSSAEREGSSWSSKPGKAGACNKSGLKEQDNDPYRLTCFKTKTKQSDPKKVKSLKIIKSDKKLKVSSRPSKANEKKGRGDLENAEKWKISKPKQKSQKGDILKNKSLKLLPKRPLCLPQSFQPERSLRTPLVGEDYLPRSSQSERQRILKVSARLRPKVKDPFQRRMKLEQEFANQSQIQKVLNNNLQTTDDEQFAQLICGIQV